MKGLQHLYEEERKSYYSSRAKDIKIGDQIQLPNHGEETKAWLSRTESRCLLLGVAEDTGIRANGGRGGAASNWSPFLGAFLNMQSNVFLSAQRVGILGVYTPSPHTKGADLHTQVEQIDEELSSLVRLVVEYGKVLVLIGGGHNNAYPLLCACKEGGKGVLSVLNLDAHPDFRALEGRHSGNPFRYARWAGALDKYALLGYHRAYMPQYVWEDFQRDDRIWSCSYETIAVDEAYSFRSALQEAIDFLKKSNNYALELDVDAIEGADASASSPSGFSLSQARQYVGIATKSLSPLYFHLSEARSEEEPPRRTAKRLAYLVHDFLCAHPSLRR